MVRRSAPRTTGTTRPCGAATAIPTSALGNTSRRVLRELHVHVAVAHQRLRRDLRQDVRDVMRTSGLSSRCFARARWRASCRRSPSAGRREPSTPASGGGRSSCGRSRAGATRPRRSAQLRPEPGRAAAGCACARSTSSATIRPSGPVPRICARARSPRSRAIRRASGDALIRPFAEPSLGAAQPPLAGRLGLRPRLGSLFFGALGRRLAVASAPLSLCAGAATSSPLVADERRSSCRPRPRPREPRS